MKTPINVYVVATIGPPDKKGIRYRSTAIYGAYRMLDLIHRINADLIDEATTVEEIRELGPMISIVDDERDAGRGKGTK